MKRAVLIMMAVLPLFLTVYPVNAAECLGVSLPDSVRVSDSTLVLNGVGARLATMLKVKVYVAGLYLEAKSNDAEAIIQRDQPRHLELNFLRDVDREEITDAWTEGFKRNSGAKFATLAADIDRLNGAMTDLPKGSRLEFSYAPGAGTTVTIDEHAKALIQGADFASALIAIWLGDPPNKEIRIGLLGGNCD